jgi:hypothetical protein
MSDNDDLKVAVRFKGNLRGLLEWYCDQVDMAPSAVIKSLVADKLSKFIGSPVVSPQVYLDLDSENTQVSPQVYLPRTHAGDTKNLSLDKSNSVEVDKHEQFFKSFLGHSDFVKFPERISKAIKDQWNEILDSKMSGKEMAQAYDQYVKQSKRDGDKFSHPNSWIAGHGWKNTQTKESNEPTGNYDF